MKQFKVLAIEHNYPSVDIERNIVVKGGGEFIDGDRLSASDLARACEEAHGLLVRWIRVGPREIKQFKNCKILVRYGVGTDNVDADAATEAGIIVGHVPHYGMDEVSSHAIALLMSCIRRIVPAHRNLANGGWDTNPPEKIWRTSGRTLGLIGLGNIGQAVARKMSTWNMKLLATDPYVDPAKAAALGVTLVSLENLLAQSDYVSLHVPHLPETRHLINPRTLQLIKPGAILINTARGPIVDARALLDALNSGRVASAGLDVYEEEPLPVSSPLRKHPNVVLTDHVAWYSEESQLELRVTAAEEVVRVCSGGLPRALANPDVLHRLGRWNEWTPNDTVRWQLKRQAALKGSPPAA